MSNAGKIAAGAIAMLLVPLATGTAQTTTASTYDASNGVFRLDGGDVTYAFGVTKQGLVATVYWGGRLREGDSLHRPDFVSRPFELNDTPQEFAGWGGGLLTEPGLKVTFPDGNRDLVLHYVSHDLKGSSVEVTLKDVEREVYVVLHYAIDAHTGMLARSAEVVNKTSAPFVVEQMGAAEWNLPRSTSYQLRYLSGRWGGEDQLQMKALTPGATVLESRRGTTGDEFAPWFAVAKNASVSETDGEVWFGGLAWSGSWRITVQQDPMQQVRISGYFNPFDFAYPLAPGETLKSPVFYGGVAQHGYEEMSRLESEYQRAHILPHGPDPRVRPVLYNSWEATEFHVSEQSQAALAEKAAAVSSVSSWMTAGSAPARTTTPDSAIGTRIQTSFPTVLNR